MQFVTTKISGVIELRGDRNSDQRGAFMRTFCAEEFAAAGIDFHVVQANVSTNVARHTLRGMHLQRAPHAEAKIVTCLRGRLFDVAVDLRPASATYLQWHALELDGAGPMSVFLDAGIAHGFLTMEDNAVVQYLMSAPHVPSAATEVRWDDPQIGIEWPAPPTIISERDQQFHFVNESGDGR